MAVCDKAGKTTDEAKLYLKAIIRRLQHVNPHVCLQAATVSTIVFSTNFLMYSKNKETISASMPLAVRTHHF